MGKQALKPGSSSQQQAAEPQQGRYKHRQKGVSNAHCEGISQDQPASLETGVGVVRDDEWTMGNVVYLV